MARCGQRFAAAACLLLTLSVFPPAFAKKPGGILKLWLLDSPASMSIHEEATVVAERPVMGVFSNLVLFDQHVRQNSLNTIVPELAKSWSWSEDGTELTFRLHDGVKWHDGKSFTAADVKCTWELLTGKAVEKLRVNPRKAWYANLDNVTTNGEREVTFHLKRPQPAFLALLASGMSPVYPCHVTPAQMRQHPIGTGPFKFVEFKPNEGIGLKAAAMQPPPGGLWGMPKEMLEKLPGYGPDVAKNRAEAREIMQKLGYGPDHRLKVTVSTRDTPPYRDPAVILMDQLKEIYIDSDLEPLDTTQWYPRVMRKDYTVGLNLTGTYVDDPDALL